MSAAAIVVLEQPGENDRKAVVEALIAFNDKAAGPSGFQPIAVLLQDPATAATLGGLWGKIVYDWLFVELLVVPEQFRGQGLGAQILGRAEAIAQARGCVGVWLDTYAFQAPGFYNKLGYEVFGSLEDHPRGSQRFFLRKRL